jgi:D-alanine-D-alanine ligase
MKKNILIIFGGRSGEHEVSVRSAQSVEQYIDKEQFNTHCLGITHQGQWRYGHTIAEITDGTKVLASSDQLALPENTSLKELTLLNNTQRLPIPTDVIFPVIHGPNGEDGTLQGMLELANLPYVGAGVLGSALGMDKVVQKQLCELHHIPQASYYSFNRQSWLASPDRIIGDITHKLQFPLFVKPANMGSSVGITKVKTFEALVPAIEDALKYDLKILVESGIEDIQEIEVSVLGNHEPIASVCGSIKPNTEFYDYETKYVTDDIEATIPANIPPEISEKIRHTATEVFTLLNCAGLARTDFFYHHGTGQHYFNEINTLPGFTSISMYPKLWAASGLPYTELITKLVALAEERWQEKQTLSYEYQP